MSTIMSFIRYRIFKGAADNQSAPAVLMVIFAYAVINTTYTAIAFPRWELVTRVVLSSTMIGLFIIMERSSLKKQVKAFAVPTMVAGILMTGCVILDGDSMIYTFLLATIMISFTYLDKRSMRLHIIAVMAVTVFIMIVFRFNFMGPNFSTTLNILFFSAYIALSCLFYVFCSNYIQIMHNLEDALKQREEDVKTISELAVKAEASDKAKSNFLATVSHEIRTPLNAILGITQIHMKRSNMRKEDSDALEKVYNSGKSLLGIINDILDMSKIETGRLELNPAEYDTPSLINDAVQLNIMRIGSKPVDFTLEVDEELPSRLYGDELRIKQILNNLLSNAIKYTERGHIRFSVSHTQEEDDVKLRFVIEDTGLGLRAEDKERLFSEYLRFNAEANRTTEGTGLGLSIAKRLAELMGGAIDVESEYGKGSRFTVTITQKAVECGAIGKDIAESLQAFTFHSSKQLEHMQISCEPMPYGRVLVVDDVDINLYVAEGMMSSYKMNIETVISGYAAINKIESGNVYDIIFMDHMMPRMDGIETAQKLRALGYDGVIIALTANALVGNSEMFARNGFDEFISKPIDFVQLDAILKKYIRDRHLGGMSGQRADERDDRGRQVSVRR